MAIKEYRLGDLIEIIRGKKPKPLEKYVTKNHKDIPWVKISDLKSNYLNNTKSFFLKKEISKTLFVEKNNLLLTIEGTVGIAFINNIDCCIDNHLAKIICFNNILKKYIFYWLIKNKNLLENLSIGSVLLSLGSHIIKNIKLLLPDIQIQQSIINIIEPFEKLKNNLENKINRLINLTKLQLNNTNINNYKLDNFFYFQGFPFSSRDFIINGNYKIYKIANIINLNQNVVTTNNFKNEVLLKEGNVVTGLSGSIGTSSIIIHNDIFLLNQRLISIESKYPLLVKMVIEKNKKNLEQLSTGSVQMNITKKDILNLKYDSHLNNKLNYFISKIYINYSKQIYLINLVINKLILLYII